MTQPESSRLGESCRIAIHSRWSSEAGYYIRLSVTARSALVFSAKPSERIPHIGEYTLKTNAAISRPGRLQPADNGLSRPPWGSRDVYCLWSFSTWAQASESFGRFCCRQARMVKSP